MDPRGASVRHPDDYGSSAEIVDIVGKGTDGVEYGFRIPAFLEFKSLVLDDIVVEHLSISRGIGMLSHRS